jgi:hypothetical protein
MYFGFQQNAGNFLSKLTTISFSTQLMSSLNGVERNLYYWNICESRLLSGVNKLPYYTQQYASDCICRNRVLAYVVINVPPKNGMFLCSGPQRSASATDSTGGRMLVQDNRRRSLSQMPEEEDASRRSKSLDGDSTTSNSALIARHFGSKVSTETSSVSCCPALLSVSGIWDWIGNPLVKFQLTVKYALQYVSY